MAEEKRLKDPGLGQNAGTFDENCVSHSEPLIQTQETEAGGFLCLRPAKAVFRETDPGKEGWA